MFRKWKLKKERQNKGSSALSGKMLLVRIVQNNIIDAYFRASYVKESLALPAGLGNGLVEGPARLRPPAGARNRKKTTPQIIFNNSRSSIKPGSAPDPLTIFTSKFRTI